MTKLYLIFAALVLTSCRASEPANNSTSQIPSEDLQPEDDSELDGAVADTPSQEQIPSSVNHACMQVALDRFEHQPLPQTNFGEVMTPLIQSYETVSWEDNGGTGILRLKKTDHLNNREIEFAAEFSVVRRDVKLDVCGPLALRADRGTFNGQPVSAVELGQIIARSFRDSPAYAVVTQRQAAHDRETSGNN